MLALVRNRVTDDAVFGNLYLNGALVCYTIENKRKAVPCGFYKIENSQSPKFKRELPLIYNDEVKAARGIRIHVANKVDDVAGCVGVGMTESGDRLKDAKLAETMVTMICRNQEQLIISKV